MADNSCDTSPIKPIIKLIRDLVATNIVTKFGQNGFRFMYGRM